MNAFFKPLLLALTGLVLAANGIAAETTILNVSYDVTREFYQEYNALFIAHWKATTGEILSVNQSHGGSSKQARSVIDGLAADVITMNQPLDIDILHERGQLIPQDWASRLPHRSVPFTSTILFVVRKGNPKHLRDWEDLVRPGISVIIPNPKTSGNGRYSYLAAWAYALKKSAGDESQARDFLRKLFANVPVLDTGGRGATTTFSQRGIGDVLLTFENEAALTLRESGGAQLEVVTPTISIIAENPVTWVDRVVAKRATAKVAQAYLEYLFSDPGQELAARHYLRPINPAVLAKYGDRFAPLELLSVEQVAGGWKRAQQVHFADEGLFDQLCQGRK